MFDHTTIRVKDYAKSRAFYEKALAPLGIRMLEHDEGGSAGFGAGRTPAVWIARGEPRTSGLHLAFTSRSRKAVDAFHAAALAAGGRDNGPPGPRADYGPDYYAAFVLDPDGNNIEAVCHEPA